MREYRLIDADCHTVEPPHIWETWLPKQFHDRAPTLVKDCLLYTSPSPRDS